MRRLLFVASLTVITAGCSSQPQAPPFKAVVDNALLGDAMHEPAAVHIWNAVGTTITANGVEEIVPKTDQEWTRLRNSAVIITEGANLLMIPPRAVDNDEWMRLSRALVDAGEAARQAAEAKDPDKLLEAGGLIYSVCNDCHTKYEGAAVQTNPPASQ
jgi:hypothetical protein